MYYRKDLTYIGKRQPKLKVPQKMLPRFVPFTSKHSSPKGELIDKNINMREKLLKAVDPSAAQCI